MPDEVARLAGARGSARRAAAKRASWERFIGCASSSAQARWLMTRRRSSRKLAARLGTSHTMIANKLRRLGLPER
jgi:transcriptional regulator of aroF, aroG, tyrA and aromatic amino acid transport